MITKSHVAVTMGIKSVMLAKKLVKCAFEAKNRALSGGIITAACIFALREK